MFVRFYTVLATFALVAANAVAEPKPFPGRPTKWEGFARYDFKAGGFDATVVVPEMPLHRSACENAI